MEFPRVSKKQHVEFLGVYLKESKFSKGNFEGLIKREK